MTATSTLAPASRGEDTVEDALAGRPWSRTDVVVAVAVAVVVIAISVRWRTEIVSSDPWRYVFSARKFPTDDWVPLGYTRYGMILPLLPLVWFFGDVQLTYYFWPVLASGVLAASLYLLGSRWWGRTAGLTAAGILVTNWVVFINLSRFYPDVFSSALVVLALVVAVVARGRMLSGGRFVVPLLLATGFLLGWSFEARETSLFMWIPVVAVLWVNGRVLRTAGLVAAPVLGWAVLDILISAVAYEDWLLKLHTFSRQDLSQSTIPADMEVLGQFVGQPRSFYLTYIPRLLAGESAPPGGIWMLVASGLALAGLVFWRRRDRPLLLISLSFLACYLLFVGIGGMFFPEHPAGRLDVQRYWVQFVPYMALAAAGVLATVTQRLPTPWRAIVAGSAGLVLIVGAGTATASAAARSPLIASNGGAALSEIRDVLGNEPASSATVWSDWQTVRLLPAYQRAALGGDRLWDFPPRSITGKDAAPAPGDYVLLVSPDRAPCQFCTGALRGWRENNPTVPPTWTPVHVTSGGGMTLYRVDG
jgi:4-amino-4-deoxy-L-arabinose transferase-like glycosyltransferase